MGTMEQGGRFQCGPYDVPIMKMSDYDVETIFENRLYMLIPFYIFNYENQLQEMNGNKAMLDELIMGYRYIFERLEKEQKMGNLSELSLSAIMKLTYRVAYKLTRKQEKVQEKVGEVMGGKVLDLPEFRIYDLKSRHFIPRIMSGQVLP